MQRELYFDISSEESGGSLYRLRNGEGTPSFLYHHSTYDTDRDEVKVFETPYPTFEAFWKELLRNREWFYLHPMFVHPEQRAFVQGELAKVNWSVHPDPKWQESHKRQWRKVLNDPARYYGK